jgi:hypothetical protein
MGIIPVWVVHDSRQNEARGLSHSFVPKWDGGMRPARYLADRCKTIYFIQNRCKLLADSNYIFHYDLGNRISSNTCGNRI